MTCHRHIRVLTFGALRPKRFSSRATVVALALLTLFDSSKAVNADTLGPELICDKKAARLGSTECVEYRVFDEAGKETKFTRPIAYGRCPKGFHCAWDNAADVTEK